MWCLITCVGPWLPSEDSFYCSNLQLLDLLFSQVKTRLSQFVHCRMPSAEEFSDVEQKDWFKWASRQRVYKQLLHVLLNNTMGLMSKTKSRLWTWKVFTASELNFMYLRTNPTCMNLEHVQYIHNSYLCSWLVLPVSQDTSQHCRDHTQLHNVVGSSATNGKCHKTYMCTFFR